MRSGILIPDTVGALVRALCIDYPRRREIIENHTARGRVENELKYYNYKIYDAVAEIIDERMVENMISDIGERRGYGHSDIIDISETTYKIRKQEAVFNIAKGLYLING